MIDWLTCYTGYDAGKIELNRIIELNPQGEICFSKEKWATAEGSYSSTIQISRDTPTPAMLAAAEKHGLLCSPHTVLKFSGNPTKFLQGHNAFGPSVSQLGSLVKETVRHLPENLRPEDAQDDRWPALHRSRVDMNVMVDLGSHRTVHEVLRHFETSTRSRHGRALVSGDTVYWGKNSRRWSIKAYCKFCELQVHRPDDTTGNLYSLLRDWSEGQLRIELTLRTPELKERGTLDESLVWEYFKRITVGVMKDDAAPGELVSCLRPQVQQTFLLWQTGYDVRLMMPRRTFYKYRSEILDIIGVDISLTPDKRSNVERQLFDVEYLKQHEVKNLPSELFPFQVVLPSCPSWPPR